MKLTKQETLCPRCKVQKYDMELRYPALSRRDNKTHICNTCGNEEALIDAGLAEVDEKERQFVEKLKKE